MPRVVPSQVLDLIDQSYPWAKDFKPGTGGDLPAEHASRLKAVFSMIDQIPSELLMNLSGPDYADLLIAKSDVEGTAELNVSRGGNRYFPHTVPVTIRRVLGKCADEPPAPASVHLNFIKDADLRESIRLDIGAADRALSNAEWKSATVLAGSAIEALLLWAITLGPKSDVAKAAAGIVAAGRRRPDADPNRWDLSDYAAGAKELSVIKPETFTACELSRGFRNLIHPGKAARLNQVCDRGTAHTAIGALDHVIRDLT